jgi:predicted DCC family thiol-disulfide oxidoreductase YuxK
MHLPFGFTRALTTATLAIERSTAFLILTPLFWRWTRALAIVLLAGLHVGIALLANFGVFSVAMLAYLPLLLDESHWRVLSALVPMRGRRRQVFYDAGCGVCFQIVRVLARMDVHRRLTWISNQDRAALPEGVDTALLERTMLVVDPHTGRRWTRSDGFAQVFAALPFGRLWAWVLLVPGLRALAGRAYDAFARNRTVLSTQLGLAACGVPAAAPSAAAPPASPRTPLGDWARARLPFLREAALAVGLVVAWADLSVTNPAVPEALRWRGRPEWMATAVMYPHLSEAWSMFSPDAPRSDQMILIDAVTREGRRVDPYNEAASRVAEVPLGDIPPRLGQDSLFCDYTLRIPDSAPYFQALIEWVLRYHERTGRPRDQVLRFQAWVIEHDSPPPGERRRNSPVRLHKFVEWPIPGEGR